MNIIVRLLSQVKALVIVRYFKFPTTFRLKMIAPAAGICGSPRDYSKWLSFVLKSGSTPEEDSLVDKDLWNDMWIERQFIGDPWKSFLEFYQQVPLILRAYATGWFSASYRGKVLLKIDTVWVFIKIGSIPIVVKCSEWPSGAPLNTFSKF